VPRVTGKNGETAAAKKPAILLMHGGGSTADSWLYNELTWDVVDLGYDVWFGNNRGNVYTKHSSLDPIKDAEEYWNFSWAEFGLYDVRATVEHIKKTTSVQKVWYMGYSQGTIQMFYGLAHLEEEYYKNAVEGFIALAPCMMIVDKESSATYYADTFDPYDKAEVYVSGGPDAANDKIRYCAVNPDGCEAFSGK
jgi:pimeloyl-ACP methyl ester carboxylesterase